MHSQDFFYDRDHAEMYIIDSVIRLGEEPVYITDVEYAGDDIFLYYQHLVDANKMGRVRTDNPDINMNPVDLGMCQYNNRALYTSRIPRRMWKIGLNKQNFSYQYVVPQNIRAPNMNTLLFSKGLVHCIKGEYPSFEEAQSRVLDPDNNELNVGFSRSFCLTIKAIYYKWTGLVGYHKKQEVRLLPEFKFLQEQLEEDMNRC